MPTPIVMLFDLGGVLVKSNGQSALRQLLPHMTDEQVLDRWNRSKAVGLFERGQLAQAQFAAAFVKEWDLPMTESAFLNAFATWVAGYFDGTMPLVQALRAEYRIGCLSNTNVVHWERLAELIEQFHFSFASHITGLMKPDRRAYDHVVRTLGIQPSDVYFFDDLLPNVAAAREMGINAFLATCPQDVESILQMHHLLPSERT